MQLAPRLKAVTRRINRLLANQSLILMYHRVATPTLDPWSLYVSPEHFAEHLEVLKKEYAVVSVHALGDALRASRPLDKAVAISFDDGYADNFLNARPLLESTGLCATVFVTSGQLEQRREFWWDELEHLLLQVDMLPTPVSLRIDGEMRSWSVETVPETRDPGAIRAWEGAPGSRMALYHAIWEAIVRLPESEQQAVLAQLRSMTSVIPEVRATQRTMTVEEVSEVARGGAIEIGAHTVSHPCLTARSASEQRREIEDSKKKLEDVTGQKVRCFAFPFGDHDAQSVRLTREVGFDCACTTVERPVWRYSDPFRMPRIAVEDWDGDEFARRLNRQLGRS